MAKGENIYKRKDGRWEGRFKKGYDKDRRIVYGYCYGNSYRETKEKMQKLKAEWKLHFPVKPEEACKKTFSVCSRQWLMINESRLKKSTLEKYASMLLKHAEPYLGKYVLTELTSYRIAEFSNMLLYQKQLAPKTVRDILTFTHKILTYMQEDTGNRQFSIVISYPRVLKNELRVLSVEEQHRLTQYLLQNLDIYKFAILLALLTGLRVGEVSALQWKDISLEERLLNVNHTIQRVRFLESNAVQKTELQMGLPKTLSSIRTIPLTAGLVSLCRRFQKKDPSAFIMTGTQDFIDPRKLQRRLKKYTDELGMEDVHFHTLRHTFATRCIESGCDTKTLSELLGHANIATTMNRYVHPSLDFKRENIGKLEQAGFFPPSQKPSEDVKFSELIV